MQVYRLHFDLPGIEIRNPPNFFCYDSFHPDKTFPYYLQRSGIKAPYTMRIDAKKGPWCKNSPEETQHYFAPGSTFQRKRNGFINTLCSRSKRSLPMVIEINKNHQITIPIGKIGFPSFEVGDRDEPEYQILNPYELTSAIISSNERHIDYSFLHSTVPAKIMTNSNRSSLELKIRFFNNPIQLNLASLLMPQ